MEIKAPELEKITSLLEDIRGLLQHMTTPPVRVADPETLVPVSEVAEPTVPTVPTAEPKTPEMPPLPTSEPKASFTLKELVKACKPLIDGGKREQIKEIITNMGYDQLSSVPPEKYEAFAASIRDMGAEI